MKAVARTKPLIKAKSTGPAFEGQLLVHDPEEGQPVTLPDECCLVAILAYEPLTREESFRDKDKDNPNPYVVYHIQPLEGEVDPDTETVTRFSVGSINVRTATRHQNGSI